MQSHAASLKSGYLCVIEVLVSEPPSSPLRSMQNFGRLIWMSQDKLWDSTPAASHIFYSLILIGNSWGALR